MLTVGQSRLCPYRALTHYLKLYYTAMPPKKGAKAGSSRINSLPAEYPAKIGGKGLEQPQWGACRAMLEGVYIAKNGS